MKQLTIILLCLLSTAYGQFAPTSAKTKFVNGIAIGSRDTSQFTAADTIALTIARDSVMYYRYRGFWRPIATGGNLSAYKLISDTLFNNGYTTRARLKQGLDSLAATKVSSVGLTMPSAFNVANSPITSSGTIAVTAAGNASQYIRGDGVLANLPTSGEGGGASVSYYLNGSVNQGTIGGVTYYEMNKTPIIGAGTDFSRSSNGYIASFLTDANDPALLVIPAGNWNFETYFEASSGGGTPSFYIELYRYDGTNFWLIATNSGTPKLINDGTSIEAYFSALAVPQTTLALTDRLAIRIFVTTAGRTITLHTENNTLCQVITTFTTGLTALNGLTEQVQYFATGTSGSDFNIASATATHTFNLPTASATNRGALSSANWTTFNNKIGPSDTASMLAPFIQYSDTTGLFGNVVRTFGTQTIGGNKTFSNDIVVNGLTVGRGAGNSSQNAAFGTDVMLSNTTGVGLSAFGQLALRANTDGTDNSAFGTTSLRQNTSGTQNSAFGAFALREITTGSFNIGLGWNAGSYLADGTTANATGSQGIYIGRNARASANGLTNETVIGTGAIGNGSNTVTIGNSSVTNNYFTGNIRGGAFIRSGGTSSQFLKADGSVDGTAYQAALTLTTTGTSGAATLVGSTLNIPNYGGGGISGSGTANQLTYWNGTSSVTGSNTLTYSPTTEMFINNSVTASGGIARGINLNPILTVSGAANTLVSLDIVGSYRGAISTAANSFSLSSGTGYVTGTYTNVPLTGGTGTGALATITVNASGNANTVTITNGGSGYSLGDVLSASNANLGGTGSGFTLTVRAIANLTTSAALRVDGINIGRGGGFILGNTAVGQNALRNNTIGSGNTAFGNNALSAITTGNNNSAFGLSALLNNSTGSGNSAFGVSALPNNTGSNNTAVGQNAITGSGGGSNNTAVGQQALTLLTTGTQNSALGHNALAQITTASNNIGIGWQAGRYATASGTATSNATGAGSVFIGYDTRPLANGQTNQIVISGYTGSGDGQVGLGSNTTVIGNASTTTTALFGNLLLGTTTDNGARLQVSGSNAAVSISNGSDIWYNVTRGSSFTNIGVDITGSFYNTNTNHRFLTNDGVTTALTIASTGAATFSSSVTATGFIVSSDLRYKNIISQDGDLYKYTLKADETNQIHYGYIAQEVEKTLPFAVTTNADGYKAVNYIEVLTLKVRELEKKIEQLEKRNK